MQGKPENMGYEPDGPVGMALCFLRGALGCEAFEWDADQHEYATKSAQDSEVWLKSTIARLASYEAALRPFVEAFEKARNAYADRYQDREVGVANFDKMPGHWAMEKLTFDMNTYRIARKALETK